MHDETGCSFYMYSTEQFLKFSKEFLAVDIKQEVIKEAQDIKTEDEETAKKERESIVDSPFPLTGISTTVSKFNAKSIVNHDLQRFARESVFNAEIYHRMNEQYRIAYKQAQQIVNDYRKIAFLDKSYVDQYLEAISKRDDILRQAQSAVASQLGILTIDSTADSENQLP